MKTIKQYANTKNGGQEKIIIEDGKYFISSDWGDGFSYPKEVSKEQALKCAEWTNAPEEIINLIR